MGAKTASFGFELTESSKGSKQHGVFPMAPPERTSPAQEPCAGPRPSSGIVRPARRPHGWQAPGPRPAGTQGSPDLLPGPNEDLCFLTGDWRVFQRVDGHRWSLDDLVTAALATDGPAPARALDLGCGIGSVLLMVAWAYPNVRAIGIEAQSMSADLADRSIRYNGCSDRVCVVRGDFRAVLPRATARFERKGFDLVTGTPPYFAPGTHTVSLAVQRGPCRHTLRGGVSAYMDAAAAVLAPSGRLVCCMAVSQREEAVSRAQKLGFSLRRRWRVVPVIGKPELIDVTEWMLEPSPLVEERMLTVRDEAGQWTAEFQAIRARMGLPPRRLG